MCKKINSIFLGLVVVIFLLPCIFTKQGGTASGDENRVLSKRPSIFHEDGSFNKIICTQFEEWVNDNVGFRKSFVGANTWIQYYLFSNLAENDMYLGEEGELNYATKDMLRDYQHLNLYPQEQQEEIAVAYRDIQTWLEQQGIRFYYMQCFDKHSIYPEQFMGTVNQYGEISKTEQLLNTMQENGVNVISVKEVLIEEKARAEVYSVWGDPTHWNRHGAHIGYLELMRVINAQNDNRYKVLQEEDFDITLTDQGNVFNGVVHKEDWQKSYRLKEQQAVEAQNVDWLGDFATDERHHVYTNDVCGNDTKLLIVGDSYLENYLLDTLAESFGVVMFVQADHTKRFDEIIEQTEPDIVVYECAERCDRSGLIQAFAELKL